MADTLTAVESLSAASFAAYDQLPDPVMIHSSGKWVYANPAAVTLLRAGSVSQLVGRDIFESVPATHHGIVGTRVRLIASGASTSSLDQQLVCADGTVIDVAISGSAVVLAGGRPGAIIVVRDITAQTRAEHLLHESEKRFRTMVESGFQLVLLVGVTGVIQYSSKSVRRLLGYEREEIIGKELFEFVHPEDLPPVVERFAQLGAEEGGRRRDEVRLRHRAGGWRSFEYAAINLADDPAVGAIVVHARDVSEQVELAADLSTLRQIDSMGRIATHVAHEFNNLLMSIGPYTDVLVRRADGDVRLAQIAAALSAAVTRGQRIVEQIRQFGKGVVVERQHFDLTTWLGDLEPELQRLVPPAVHLALGIEGSSRVFADPKLLSRAVTQLVIHAREATRPGDSIEVTARHLPRAGAPPVLHLVVAYTGAAASPDRIAQSSGTGLGLAVVEQIVAAQGGRIVMESDPSAGTNITLLVPV
jgi:PAS domain S-box-containing protein